MSVFPSKVLPRRLNPESLKQRYPIAQVPYFFDAEDLDEIPTGSLPTGAPNRGWVD